MLSISPPLSGAGQGDYYLELAQEDYYTNGGEPPGRWYGEGAEALDLKGKVEPEELRSVLHGYSKEDGKTALVQNAGADDRQAGWDLTFSAPKSVSVAWSQASPEVRREIQEAQAEAVGKALGYLEAEAGVTRRGKGGLNKEPAKLTFAEFEHGTSRAQDPQLHTHCLLINVGVREDGTTGSIESRGIFKHKMAAGAVYRAELSYRLESRLGLESERKKNWFELKGVSPSLVDEFSKRRKEVERALHDSGFSGPVAAKVATLNSREVKEHVARETLFAQWQKTGLEHGFGEKELSALIGQAPKRDLEAGISKTLDASLEKATSRESHFAKRDFVRFAAEEAQGRGLGADAVVSGSEKYLRESPEIVRLGMFDGESRYTTREMIELERKTLSTVKARREEDRCVGDSSVSRALTSRPELSDEQKRGVKHITQEKGGVQVVSGLAGTGKSKMLDAAREAYERDGFTVIGAAPSGIAAKGLEESSGIKSKTLHRTLSEIKRGELPLNEKTVLVLDEAGMVGTRQMADVVEKTGQSGAKLILVGDEKQLQSIEAGGGFKALSDELGRAELKGIRRQREEWAREAVAAFSRGDSREALLEYASRGHVTVSDTPKEAKDTLLMDWKKEGVSTPDKNLIIVGTNVDAKELNQRAQAMRYSEGKLSDHGLEASGYTIHAGDRVVFTRNSSLYGVQNGSLGVVTEADARSKTISARLDDGKQVKIPLTKYEDVKLGYAVTTHKAQGSTFEKTYVLAGGPMQDRELTYVQASRARGETHFYMDKVQAGDKLTEISRSMAVSHQKSFATDLAKQATVNAIQKERVIDR